MISGYVTADLEPVITLNVQGATGAVHAVSFLIDTGFSGSLPLPADLVSRFALQWCRFETAELADGREITAEIYLVRVEWDDDWLDAEIMTAGPQPLLGMKLLEDYRLTTDVVDGGNVEIKPLVMER